jgi:hypothetical protein
MEGPHGARVTTSRRHRLEEASESFWGSPVTTMQVARAMDTSEGRSLKSMGPGNFQAIREIGQGAFGKVHPQHLILGLSSRTVPTTILIGLHRDAQCRISANRVLSQLSLLMDA